MLSISKRILMSFTVFAMFFGAGNLIFPVFLAYQAGEAIMPAFFGFALSAIGLPVLALVAITRTDGLGEIAGRAGSRFSRLFTIAVYLAIGPCLAIPRTASTSYEMVALALGTTSTLQTLAYCVLFFTLAALVSRRPEKLSSRLGRILAPLLVLLIVVLTSGTVMFPSAGAQSSTMQSFQARAFSQGFVDGYQTMDAIAGLVFGTILALNVEKAGCEHRQTRRECMIASIAGGVLILVVYLALAIVGCASRNIIDSPTNGAQILSAVSSALFPTTGRFLIAAIFILACFNTCVGLLSSCGQYFSTIVPKVSRDRWIAVFALASLALANTGLDAMISISSPVLEILYPVAMTLMVLAFLPRPDGCHHMYSFSVTAAFCFSIVALVTDLDFIWILPVIAGAVAGYTMDIRAKGKDVA